MESSTMLVCVRFGGLEFEEQGTSDEEKISIIKQEHGWWVVPRNPLYPYFTGWLMLCYLSSDQRAQSAAEKSAEVHARYVTCLYARRQIRKLSITQAGQSRQFQSTCVYTEHVKHIPLLTRGGLENYSDIFTLETFAPQWLAW